MDVQASRPEQKPASERERFSVTMMHNLYMALGEVDRLNEVNYALKQENALLRSEAKPDDGLDRFMLNRSQAREHQGPPTEQQVKAAQVRQDFLEKLDEGVAT